MKRQAFILFALFTSVGYDSSAQTHVREDDKMFKKTVVRAIDLREKQNKPLFSKNREISRFLIEAVKNGDLVPYASDSLKERLSMDAFMKKMIMPSTEAQITDSVEISIINGDGETGDFPGVEYYFAKDFYQMEIKEEVVFDKQKSRMYYDIQSITLYIPADHPNNLKGIQEVVASFNYKDVVKAFKDNPNAIYYNPQNESQHKNLTEAFELRLFSSYLVKVSNADDLYLSDIYKDQQKGIMASQWENHGLLEFEHNLWEF